MIDLGESEKVTAVLMLFYVFLKCLDLPGVIIFRDNFYIFNYPNISRNASFV